MSPWPFGVMMNYYNRLLYKYNNLRAIKKLNVRKLYEVKDIPIFQHHMYNKKNDALNCPKGDVLLVEDLSTGFVYNQSFNSNLMVYDENYQNEQGCSSNFLSHLEIVSKIIKQQLGTNSIIEVGCGQGTFLELLQRKGFKITGFDPAYQRTNKNIIKKPFDKKHSIKSEGLILRHVLEHIKSPYEFLNNLRLANDGKGKIYIEVPCLNWIIKNKAWYDIYYEHVNYFRLSDLTNMFNTVYDFGRLFGNQYIYIVADLSSLKRPIFNKNNSVKFPKEFIKDNNPIKENINSYKKSFVWGGGSKGVIFILLKRRFGYKIDGIVDINPAKQGKYIPAVGEKVLSPKEAGEKFPEGSNCYVMNFNYFNEIKEMSNNKYNYKIIE